MASLLLSLNKYSTLPPLSQGLLPRYCSSSNLKKTKNLLLPDKPFTPKCLSVSSLSPLLDEPAETVAFEVEDDDENQEQPLCEVWKEIQGCNNWEGLLDPMDSHLREKSSGTENSHKPPTIPSTSTLTPNTAAPANTKAPISSRSWKWRTEDTKSAAIYTLLPTSTSRISSRNPR
jgi:hypothetical protein